MQATGITHLADQRWIPFLADNASARGSRWCWPRNGNYAARRTHDLAGYQSSDDLLELLSELNREKGYTLAAVCTILIRPVVTPAI